LDNLFDPSATPGTRHRTTSANNTSNNNNINNSNSNNLISNTNNSSNTPLVTSISNDEPFTTSTSTTHVTSEKHKGESDNAKDPYLVDVDVDVDGVMMDGLDQVEYMNRGVGNSSSSRFYADGDDDMLLSDDEGDVYGGEQSTRFITEPISRTLEALALEGLTEF
jgi:hypothetical protein